jgi:hypothetical protein
MKTEDDTVAATAQALLDLLDLERPDLKPVADCARRGDHAGALTAYRDYFLDKIRRKNLGQWGYFHHSTSPEYLDIAEFLAGRMTPEQYLGKDRYFVDEYGLHGAPGTGGRIDWMKRVPLTVNRCDISGFLFASGLVIRYAQTGDPVYLRKYFELAADFCVRQKPLADALWAGWSEEERQKFGDNPMFYGTTSWQVPINTSARVHQVLRHVAALSKLITPAARARPLDNMADAVAAPASAAERELIRPLEIAQIAISLMRDQPLPVLDIYVTRGWGLPNQRLMGFNSLSFLAAVFDEFKLAAEYIRLAVAGFADFIKRFMSRDGGMLEHSFNYNVGDVGALFATAANLPPACADSIRALQAAAENSVRMFAALLMPDGGLPIMGNNSYDNSGAGVFRLEHGKWICAAPDDDNIMPRIYHCFWRAAGGKFAPPTFTSVHLPYIGYAIQRSGWAADDRCLFLFNGRPAWGHTTMGYNGIQMAAYGRRLLVCAGSALYGPRYMDQSQAGEFEGFNEFFGEDVSFKANTVIVDGLSQSRRDYLMSTAAEPLGQRWHTSPAFDLIEGIFAKGYGGGGGDHNARYPAIVQDVVHRRAVVFVKAMDLWVVLDELRCRSAARHEYTQLWNYPSAHPDSDGHGFAEPEVICDEAAKTIRTAAPAGANVTLLHFAPFPLRYAKYHGAKNPHRGWYGKTMSGMKHPAVHVQASWISAAPWTFLVTVVAPDRGLGRAFVRTRDVSSAGQCGFTAERADGSQLICLHNASQTPFAHEELSVLAGEAWLVRDPHGNWSGVVLGGQRLSVNGTQVGAGQADFEFRLRAGKVESLTPVLAPTDFRWETDAGRLVPAYR